MCPLLLSLHWWETIVDEPPENCDLLLLKVPPVLLVDKYQVKVVARGILFVDVTKSWSELKASKKQTNGDSLA